MPLSVWLFFGSCALYVQQLSGEQNPLAQKFEAATPEVFLMGDLQSFHESWNSWNLEVIRLLGISPKFAVGESRARLPQKH